MTDIKPILINMVMLGLLIFGIINVILIIQIDNEVGPDDRITNNTLINESYGNLQTNLNQQTLAQNASDSLEDTPPQVYVGDLNVASTVAATRTAKSIITGLWNVLVKLPQVILGVDSSVASAINIILLILIAIGIWAIWKGAIS